MLETKAYNVVNILPPDWPSHSFPPSHQYPELIHSSRTLANEAAMQMLNKTICWKEIPPSGTEACFLGSPPGPDSLLLLWPTPSSTHPLPHHPHCSFPIVKHTHSCRTDPNKFLHIHMPFQAPFLYTRTHSSRHMHIHSFHSYIADNRPLEALSL